MWIKMRNILQQVFTDTESPRAEYYTLVDRERNDWHMKFPVKAPNSVLEIDVIFKIFHIFLEPGWLKVRLHNQGSAWSPSSLVSVYSILEIRSRAPLYQMKFVHRQTGTFRLANLMVKTVVENVYKQNDEITAVGGICWGRGGSIGGRRQRELWAKTRRWDNSEVGEELSLEWVSPHTDMCAVNSYLCDWQCPWRGHGGAVVLRRTRERESRSRYVYVQKETYLNKLALMIMRPSVFKIL